VRFTSNADRPLPDARGTIAGRSEGEKTAYKHGLYSAKAIAPEINLDTDPSARPAIS
jgi:hypothetical protein